MWVVDVVLPFLLVLPCAAGNIVLQMNAPIETSNEIVYEKWNLLDKSLRQMMNSDVMTTIYNILETMPLQLGVLEHCAATLLEMVEGLKQVKGWPIEMFDASGRIPSGLISQTTADMGNYDQCVDIDVKDSRTQRRKLQGQHCMISVRPSLLPNSTILNTALRNLTMDNHLLDEIRKSVSKYYRIPVSIGVCLPSTCSENDVNKIVSYMVPKVGLTGGVHRCTIKEERTIDSVQISVISVTGILVILCIVGTCMDNAGKNSKTAYQQATSKGVLLIFSVKRNFRKLFSVKAENDNELRFLHGLRFYFVNWIFIGHTCLIVNNIALHSSKWPQILFETLAFQVLNLSSIGVDSFLLISSFLMTYLSFKKTDELGTKVFIAPAIIFHRIVRYIPSLLMCIGFLMVLPLVGSGALFHANIVANAEICRRNWWYNLLFINNFLPPQEMCLIHTWFVAVDIHIFFVAIIFMLIAFRNLKLAIIFNFMMILISIASTAAVNYWKDIPPCFDFSELESGRMMEYLSYYHSQTHAHLSVGCIGMLLGAYLARRKKGVPHKVLVLIGWSATALSFVGIIYYPLIWIRGAKYSLFESLAFSSLCRVVWAIGNSWIIFACYTGCGGILNAVLSWPAIIPFARLNLLVFLWNYVVISYRLANVRVNSVPIIVDMTYIVIGDIAISYFLALISNLLYESPFIQLEKIAIGIAMKKKFGMTREELDSSDKNGKTS